MKSPASSNTEIATYVEVEAEADDHEYRSHSDTASPLATSRPRSPLPLRPILFSSSLPYPSPRSVPPHPPSAQPAPLHTVLSCLCPSPGFKLKDCAAHRLHPPPSSEILILGGSPSPTRPRPSSSKPPSNAQNSRPHSSLFSFRDYSSSPSHARAQPQDPPRQPPPIRPRVRADFAAHLPLPPLLTRPSLALRALLGPGASGGGGGAFRRRPRASAGAASVASATVKESAAGREAHEGPLATPSPASTPVRPGLSRGHGSRATASSVSSSDWRERSGQSGSRARRSLSRSRTRTSRDGGPSPGLSLGGSRVGFEEKEYFRDRGRRDVIGSTRQNQNLATLMPTQTQTSSQLSKGSSLGFVKLRVADGECF
ncbi:LOW QUALITY PROTEIN: hypothetical protein CVT26_011951 [Gymnopilus dilepis]|uniref:Uncharacterized protein n=1 Tax=Gymnopilus dilepis TaxID=231916 RepID=A0A409VYJ3_9AGAR|nr:LOW QUALITY PROTEIN: hypothetical protein CVT26_011951 [Gymnopilus dilepis]